MKEKKDKKNEFFSQVNTIMSSNYFKWFGVFFLICILMTITYTTRTGAVDFEGNFVCKFKQNFNSNLDCGLTQNIKSSILNQIQQQIAYEIQATYPNLNEQFLAQEVQKRYLEVIETNTYQGQDLNIIVESQLQAYISQFQSDDNQTYLTAIDPYYFMGLATLHHKNGYVGTTLNENNEPVVEYRLAPNGVENTKFDFHTFLISNLFSLNGVDKENPSYSERMSAIFTLSAIISALVVIPLFLLLRDVTNTPFAFIGTLILVTSTIFVSRTQAGFVDTDAYNLFFPLLITALLYFALRYKSLITKIILAALAGISMAIFIWAWGPGWFFLLFSLAALAVPISIEMFSKGKELLLDFKKNKKKSSIKKEKSNLLEHFSSKIIAIVYFLTAEILSVVFLNIELFSLIYGGLTRSLSSLTQVSNNSMWPNVLSSVAELNAASITQIFQSLLLSTSYGQLFTILGLCGIFIYLISNNSVEELIKKGLPNFNINIINILLALLSLGYFSYVLIGLRSLTVNNVYLFLIILALPLLAALAIRIITHSISKEIAFFISITLIWFLGGLFMSLNGTRFILLLAPAFTLLLSYGCYIIALEFVKVLQLEFKKINAQKSHMIISILICLVMYLMITPQIDRAYAITNSNVPNFDDNWYDLMEFTKENTSQDAIISSWWDFGHFFAAIGERGVVFDGASQGTPASYWTGHWLMQNDEDVATDILRMMSCSGNNGYDYIYETLNDSSNGVHAFNLVNNLMGKSKDEKEVLLQNYSKYSFTTSQINEILELIHCDEPRQMLAIASGDMISKAGVWAHWGSWSFERKYVHANYKSQSVDEMSEILDLAQSEVQELVNGLEEINDRVERLNFNRNDLENQWLAPYPSYAQATECPIIEGVINCNGAFMINLSGEIPQVSGELLSGLNVSRIIIPSPFDFRIEELNDNKQLDIVVIVNSQNSAQILPAQYPLGGSMFTRLYYFNGIGTSKFEELKSVQTQTAGRVGLWNVNFDKERESISFEDLIQINSNSTTIDVSNITFTNSSSNNSN